MWDPAQYGRFASERSRPFFDLLGQVALEPRTVVDLGCGSGGLTASLLDRWPGAVIRGIDSSPEMIDSAAAFAVPGRLSFELGDIAQFEPDEPVDLIVSNAALHWVPGHRSLLAKFATYLQPEGALAFQVPGNFGAPSHVILRQLATSDRWRQRVGAASERSGSDEPEQYLTTLLDAGLAAKVWETTYLQVLSGPEPVLEWMKGTALRPVLGALDEEDGREFCGELAARLREAYPAGPHGTVLPFRRIFAVAVSEAR